MLVEGPAHESSVDVIRFMQLGAHDAAAMLRMLSNEKRLLLLCLLLERGELSVGALAQRLPLSQSALSQHLALLRQRGLVAYRRDAQTLYYRVANPRVERIIGLLRQLYCP